MENELGTSKEANSQPEECGRARYREGRNCCVPNCGSNSRRHPFLSFHRIPKDETLRKKWIKLLKAKDPEADLDCCNCRNCNSHVFERINYNKLGKLML